MSRDPPGPAASAGRILIVEDSPSARRLLHDILLRLGAELPNLRIAGSVLEALHSFAEWSPHLVFIDIELDRAAPPPVPQRGPTPEDPRDGAELALLILARNPSVKVVMCSASDPSDPRVAQLVREGRVEFITKPLLASRVGEVLKRAAPTPARGDMGASPAP